MFRKFQKENSTLDKSDGENIDQNVIRGGENLVINLIGVVNIKRWRSLKVILACKTNEDFVTKLLDIAQQYINSNQSNNEKNINDFQSPKETKKKIKLKNKITADENFTNINQTKVIEIESVKQQTKLEKKKTDKTTLENQPNKITIQASLKTTNNIPAKNEIPLQDLDLEKANLRVSDDKLESSNRTYNNLDIIRIKLCHLCDTHHIQDHCPINLPQNILSDAINLTLWKNKYEVIFNNLKENLKIEIKSETNDDDILKYSYASLSLPQCLLLGDTNSPHGQGVFAKDVIPSFSQFGPLIGIQVKEMDISEDINMKYLWEINVASKNIYINTEGVTSSNWIRFIRPASTRDEKNLAVISKEDKLYFVSAKQINAGEELLYWQECPNTTNKKKMEKTTCGGCNMVFDNPQYYRIHCSVFHDVRYSLTIKKYHCKVCGEAVLGKENIMKHAIELHNGQGAYQCQFCQKFFLRLNYLEMHRTYGCSANPHRSKPLCDFCGRKFCQPQKLKVHIKRMHSDFADVLKEFQCKICLKILGSRAALQRHAKEVHRKQTECQFSCVMCGKKFQNKSNLKIHMLTHSGIKPFRCTVNTCNAAFTTKQCLQFHYKKVHNFTEVNMPKIERSIDYTFQAYSGTRKDKGKESESFTNDNEDNEGNDKKIDSDNESSDSQGVDDPVPRHSPETVVPETVSPETLGPETSPPPEDYPKTNLLNANVKVLSKGSKKWIADPASSTKIPDIYSIERLSKDNMTLSLQEADIYDRNKMAVNDFNRQDASNASLLVEAAIDSVCNEPNIDIDVSTSQSCTDTLVNNLYTLTQPDNLPEVSYTETACINDSRDINLISPSVNDHISVTDELNDELSHNDNIGMHYTNFQQNDFSPPHSPDMHRSNFVRNYINSLSPQNTVYAQKSASPVPSPPRYDFGHNVNINTEHLSSDESNGMVVQNLSLNNTKSDIQLDLSIYKTSYKPSVHDYMRKLNYGNKNNLLEQDHIDVINENDISHIQDDENKESNEEMRNKFDIDLDIRLKTYENIDNEAMRLRNHNYENNELDFRSKTYELIDTGENRNKPYDLDSDFRSDRNFEPLVLNPSELQGLDMSARSFQNYTNMNRYHHLYPDVDRVDLRLNYSPPPPTYTHADILRVVSLDLTPPGRHSVDLSLRNHPLHQIANTRLLTEHSLQTNHRLLDQSRLLSADLTSSRIISETSSRILTDHTTSRILNESISTNHLLNADQNRILGEESRLLDQGRLIGDARILPTTPAGTISPVPAFGTYSVPQNPYHPTPIGPRPHVTSPTPTPYHYPTYY